jgi:D-amino peptidase
MRAFVITDIEGVAGVDSFASTRTTDEAEKGEAMDQLAREVNACVEGIRSVAPGAEVDVWDGHGTGGLREADVEGATYLDEGRPYFDLDHDAVLFVGQHAMAGAFEAPLCHTYSSRSVAYYRLDGTFVGEFGCRALVAGLQGVPTVFLAGDDKAALEAEAFVPGIETSVTKFGRGREAADHRDPGEACDAIREGAARAVARADEVAPLDRFDPPHALEIRYYEPTDRSDEDGVTQVDPRTVRLEGDSLFDPPFRSTL